MKTDDRLTGDEKALKQVSDNIGHDENGEA